EGEMTAAGENQQLVLRMILQDLGRASGHAFVPQQLGGVEALEITVLLGRMGVECRLQAAAVSLVAAVDVFGDPLPQMRIEFAEVLARGGPGHLRRKIQGNDANAALACESQDLPIVTKVEAPAFIVLTAAQQRGFVDITPQVLVEDFLERLLKPFDGQDDAFVAGGQATQDLQLYQMMVEARMGLADEYHPALGQIGDD